MKKAAAFRPSSGGNTAKRIFSTDTADIPIRMKNFQHGYGGYSDPDDREWMYSETWLHEDGFEEKDLADIKAYIRETREHGLILGDKYISHDLVPSFYLADEQTTVCRDIAGSGICKGNSK